MKKGNPSPLPPELEAELEALAARPESKMDLTDPEIPEVADWSGGIRGAFFRPIKKPVALRVDADVLDWFQRQGPGYQTRINAVLREFMARHRGERA